MDGQENSGREIARQDFQSQRLPSSLPIADLIPNEHACSYLEGRTANLPLNLPSRLLTLDEFDVVLANGMRRSGVFLYHTACHQCSACEPTRVDIHEFVFRDSFQRVLKRGDRHLQVQINRPSIDERRLTLFNLHRTQRGLGEAEYEYRFSEYDSFLVDTCCGETVELSYWSAGELIAVSIVDCGRSSLSAVYTYFDPAYSKLSIGTFSILKQIQYALASDRKYVYLGMYVAENRHLNYKARFMPQERFVNGRWVKYF